jgi:hypothetical protein
VIRTCPHTRSTILPILIMFANTLLVALLAASSACAHYTLEFPVSRSLVGIVRID